MSDKDFIEKLFSEKLSNMEVPVRPEIWTGIQSSLNTGISSAAAAKTSFSLMSKVAIAITSVAVTAGTIVYFTSGNPEQEKHPSADETTRTETTPQNKEEYGEQEKEIYKSEQQADLEELSRPVPERINPVQKEKIKDIESEDHQGLAENKDKGLKETTIKIDNTLTNTKNSETTVYKEPDSFKEVKRDQKEVTIVEKEESKNNNSQEQKSQPVEKGKVQAWQRTNVFSPNNDGVNDLFFLETSNLKEFSISILNEKNQVVYQSQDPNFKWDGTDYKTGEIIPAGNYSYIIFAVDINGEIIKQFNVLRLSR